MQITKKKKKSEPKKERKPNQHNYQNFLKQKTEVFHYTHIFHNKMAPISVCTLKKKAKTLSYNFRT